MRFDKEQEDDRRQAEVELERILSEHVVSCNLLVVQLEGDCHFGHKQQRVGCPADEREFDVRICNKTRLLLPLLLICCNRHLMLSFSETFV